MLDKLYRGNNITGMRDLAFSVVRYGNVMGSRGSVMRCFLEKSRPEFSITDAGMTRFNISLNDGWRWCSGLYMPLVVSYLYRRFLATGLRCGRSDGPLQSLSSVFRPEKDP